MGAKFEFGNTVLTVKHTPGHTPEHVSFALAETDHEETPWGVLTGDGVVRFERFSDRPAAAPDRGRSPQDGSNEVDDGAGSGK